MEHTGATNRLGYSHTVSRLGWAYHNVISMFTASGMSMTPTLFNSAAMYVEDRSLVDDERTSLHQNLRAAVRYGMTPYEALTTATRNPARWMALTDDLGTVEAGKLADPGIRDR